MDHRILPPAPDGSRLATWAEDGNRHAPSHSNIVTWNSPDGEFGLRVELDDPVHGYLIQLFAAGYDDPIARTVVDDDGLALEVATHMAAAAEDLRAVEDRPGLGPETIHREDLQNDIVDTPDEYEDEHEEEWQEHIEQAFEKAEIPREKGTLTEKTIDGREYYYLQWREGDKIKSQYVAPVNPA